MNNLDFHHSPRGSGCARATLGVLAMLASQCGPAKYEQVAVIPAAAPSSLVVGAAPGPIADAASSDAGASTPEEDHAEEPPIRGPLAFHFAPAIADADANAAAALCQRVDRALQRRVANAPTCTGGGPDGFDVKRVAGRCMPLSGHSAWALGVRDVVADPRCRTVAMAGDVASARAYAVHATDGAMIEGPPIPFTGGGFHDVRFATGAFDYDADGEAELIVVYATGTHTGVGPSVANVFTFRRGAVRPYPPADGMRIAGVDDVDGDGRPDLLYEGPFSATYIPDRDVSDVHTSVRGPLFVAHALSDGTFAKDDPVARAYGSRGCTRAPSRVVVTRSNDPRMIDDEASLFRVRCARLHRVTSVDIEKQLDADCVPPGKGDSVAMKATRVCVHLQIMRAWARADPPLYLR